ncbi:ABC transporter permease [Candidatus Leptofilum sp.]|uniref:ABC transporter permease n=1 Tax=Candidatus Leptofilum sp. TaxID=3241576 RepID=UPI003B594CFB
MDAFILSDISRVLAALALVLFAAIISRWQAVNLERQMLIATARAFVQLIAIGFALDLIFAADHPLAIFLIIAVMVSIAGYTSGKRATGVPQAHRVALTAISIGASLTLGLLIGLRIFQFTAQETIPIAGMVIGNSMNVCTLVMRRIQDEIEAKRAEIEAALALGATGRQAVAPYLKIALQSGMTPIIDSTKTVGLIQLPGAMTGMILAGASPLEAVQLQIIVMYMLIGAAAFTGLAAAWFTHRQFISPNHQLQRDF